MRTYDGGSFNPKEPSLQCKEIRKYHHCNTSSPQTRRPRRGFVRPGPILSSSSSTRMFGMVDTVVIQLYDPDPFFCYFSSRLAFLLKEQTTPTVEKPDREAICDGRFAPNIRSVFFYLFCFHHSRSIDCTSSSFRHQTSQTETVDAALCFPSGSNVN
jgi:hypothetical protein